jgi:hypothetical protein
MTTADSEALKRAVTFKRERGIFRLQQREQVQVIKILRCRKIMFLKLILYISVSIKHVFNKLLLK